MYVEHSSVFMPLTRSSDKHYIVRFRTISGNSPHPEAGCDHFTFEGPSAVTRCETSIWGDTIAVLIVSEEVMENKFRVYNWRTGVTTMVCPCRGQRYVLTTFQGADSIYDYSLLTPQLVLAAYPLEDGVALSILSPDSQHTCTLYLPELYDAVYEEVHSLHDTRATGCYDSTFVPRPVGYSYSPNCNLIAFGISIIHDDDDNVERVSEELFLVLNRVSLINLISKLSEGMPAHCLWRDWSPGITRWLPSLYGHWRCSLFGWRIVMLGEPGNSMKQLDLWGFKIMNTERPRFNEHGEEERLLMVDFNPYQFRNLTGGEDGPLSAYYDPEKTVQFTSSGSVWHPWLDEILTDQMPCRVWVAKEPIDVAAVGIAEDTIVGFQVCKQVS